MARLTTEEYHARVAAFTNEGKLLEREGAALLAWLTAEADDVRHDIYAILKQQGLLDECQPAIADKD
jgi:hypothetical protein